MAPRSSGGSCRSASMMSTRSPRARLRPARDGKLMPVVPRQAHADDGGAGGGEGLDAVPRAVPGPVIDEHDLIDDAEAVAGRRHPLDEGGKRAFLIVTGRDDGQRGRDHPRKRGAHRKASQAARQRVDLSNGAPSKEADEADPYEAARLNRSRTEPAGKAGPAVERDPSRCRLRAVLERPALPQMRYSAKLRGSTRDFDEDSAGR